MSRTVGWTTGIATTVALVGGMVWLAAGPQTPSRGRAPAPSGAATTPVTSARAGTAASPTNASFDSARAWAHLEQMVAIGPRPSGSAELRQTRAYIGRQISAAGLTLQEQPFTASTPVGRVEMSNLVVRLPGRRPDRILFIGHYDTKILKGQRFVGASDGGSSAAFLIEFARTLAAKPQAQREFTYELVWLDGEEAICLGWYECGTAASPDNTYGSRYYVQAAEKAGALKSIRAVILVDMIIDRDLQFHRESDSTPWLKDIIWGTARSMAYERVFLDDEQAITDDHIPFLKAGIPAVDIIDLAYPYWHTPDDTLEHVSARGFQIVGDVLLAALPKIEDKLK